MAEDGSVRIKVGLDSRDAQRGVSSLRKTLLSLSEGTKLESTFNRIDSVGCKAFSNIGKVAKVGMAAAASGAAAAAASVALIGKQALDSYAKYEQMIGGVDKLFGTGAANTVEDYAEQVGKSVDKVQGEFNKLQAASQTVQKNADKAYKTAGMSANTYMESVTGFSAALINSLGGDTTKAAKQADVAMRAISDNANTFGTDVNDIVRTYQSLARGQYAMLDNLKLGYGGTKTELERLVSDANKYATANKDVAKEVGVNSKLQVDSYSDIVSAIELIQRKQQIAGTTAREAANTIEGSVNSMRAAWENWLTELGKDDGNITKTTNRFVKSTVTAASNVLPRVAKIADSIGNAIGKQLPRIQKLVGKQLVRMDFGDMLKSMQSGASNIVKGISSFVSSIDWKSVVTTVGKGIANTVQSAADYIRENGAYILAGVADVAQQVVVGIVQAAPSILAAVGNIVISIGDSIANIGTAAKLSTDESLQTVRESVSETAKAVEETTSSWDKATESAYKAGDAVKSTYGHYEGLVAQLDDCVTASGKVRDGHKDEAETIVSILNDALSTNIDIRDGVIAKYKDQRKELERLIEAKKAEALEEAYADQYQSALTGKAEALANYAKAQQDVNAAQDEYNKKLQAYNDESANIDGNSFEHSSKMAELKEALKQSKSALDTAQQTYDTAKDSYTEMENTVSSYEEAQTSLTKGDYSAAIDGFNALSDAAAHSNAEISGMSDNSEKLNALSENVTAYADQMSVAIGSGVEESKKQLEKAVTAYAKAGGDMSEALAGGIKDSSGKVELSAKEVKRILKSNLSAEDYLRAVGKDNADAYASGVASGGSRAGSSGKAVANSAASGMKSNNSSADTWGSHMAQNFASGILSASSPVATAASAIANIVAKYLKHTVPKAGPLSDDDKWGGHLVDNLASGIAKGTGKAQSAAGALAASISNTLNGGNLAVGVSVPQLAYAGNTSAVSASWGLDSSTLGKQQTSGSGIDYSRLAKAVAKAMPPVYVQVNGKTIAQASFSETDKLGGRGRVYANRGLS